MLVVIKLIQNKPKTKIFGQHYTQNLGITLPSFVVCLLFSDEVESTSQQLIGRLRRRLSNEHKEVIEVGE